MTRTMSATKWQGQEALAVALPCPVKSSERYYQRPGHRLSSTPAPKAPVSISNVNAAADFGPPI